MKKVEYYKNFSINQLRFIKAHGIRPVSKGTHENGKSFWIFEMTPELSEVLKRWTENKSK